MPGKTVEIDTDKVKGTFSRVFSDIGKALTFQEIDTTGFYASYTDIIVLVIVLSIANYIAYVIGSLLRLRLLTTVISIIFPIQPLFGIVYSTIFAYVAAAIYAYLLHDSQADLKTYMYITLLGGVHLPIAIVIVNFTEGGLSKLSSLFKMWFYICFGLLALHSDYFCRKNITQGRLFESNAQWTGFVAISLAMHIGAYVVLYPLIYVH
ncbi:hypothetical protein PAPHI01_1291 [Pancytospora philotis]|nr:hypothetical protein PAPHI01_1291 [Pancytospora philotis]